MPNDPEDDAPNDDAPNDDAVDTNDQTDPQASGTEEYAVDVTLPDGSTITQTAGGSGEPTQSVLRDRDEKFVNQWDSDTGPDVGCDDCYYTPEPIPEPDPELEAEPLISVGGGYAVRATIRGCIRRSRLPTPRVHSPRRLIGSGGPRSWALSS